MKVLFAATPVAGHINPILSLVAMVTSRGDEAVLTTANYLRPVVEAAGARFLPLAPGADLDLSRMPDLFPDIFALPPGPARERTLFEHAMVDPMPAQLMTLRAAMAEERPDVVVADSYFMGRTALFLDPARPRVPLISCGFTFLTLDRPDGAPPGTALPPARDDLELAQYAAIAAGANAMFAEPLRRRADGKLAALGLPPLPCSVLGSMVLLADAYLHPTVPSFEFDFGNLPDHVHFVGALPPPPRRRAIAPPDWWTDLDIGRPIVLITQGTLANAVLSELIEPALVALADRDDLLVLAATGGRPLDSLRVPIPANARIAEFMDYATLLPKLSALVTNGGYGTVSLSLRAGVPIVAAGRTEDKAGVGARVAWSGVGIELPTQRPSVDDLRDAVAEVLADPSYRTRARAIASDMAAIDTPAEILKVLDRVASGAPNWSARQSFVLSSGEA